MSVKTRQGAACPTPKLTAIVGSPISAAVGAGGSNRNADVKTIQCLLNAIEPADGGPAVKLAQDGLIGPKTIAAISGFQKRRLGWSDGRVDVMDKTMVALRAHIATLPSGQLGLKKKSIKDFDHPEWWPQAVIDMGIKQTKEIEPKLGNLRWRLTRQGDEMKALMEKHFVNPTESIDDADFAFLRTLLSDIHVYMGRASMGGDIRAAGVFQYSQTYPDPDKDALGFTWSGGAHVHLGGLYRDANGNPWVVAAGQTIWLTDLYAMERDTEQYLVILHEFCHFAGGVAGAATAVGDHGYAFEPHMMYIGKNYKMRNAESLALFFFENCFGTTRMLSMPRINAVRGMLSRYPHVSEHGVIDLGPKKTWPSPF